MSLRDLILGVDDLPRTEIDVPEWGVKVYVRTLTGKQRDVIEAKQVAKEYVNFRAALAAMTLCDENGALLFTDKDIEALGGKSGVALDRVYEAAIERNKISKGDIEALEKN